MGAAHMVPVNLKRTAASALATLVLAGTLTACGNGSSCSGPAALGSFQGQAVAAISVAAPEEAPLKGGGGGGHGSDGHSSGHGSTGHGDSAGTGHDPATGSGTKPRSSTPIFPFLGGHSTQCPTAPTAKP